MNDYLLLVLIELGALALLVSIAFATLLYLRRRKLHAAVQAAAKKLKKSGEDRQRTLTAILSGVHRLPESVSAGLSTQLMQCERTLLRQCFDILLSPDPASAAKLSDTLLAGLDDYLRKCAAPNMPRTEIPAPVSAGSEAAAVPAETETLPFWMNRLEKGEPPAEGEVPPEAQVDPEAFWPAGNGWIEETRIEPEAARPEEILAAEVDDAAEPAGAPETPEAAVAEEEIPPPPGAAPFAEEVGSLLDAYEQEHAPLAAAEPEPPLDAASSPSASDVLDLAQPSPDGAFFPQEEARGEGHASGGEPLYPPDAVALEEEEAAAAADTEPDAAILPPSPPAVTVEDLMAEFGLAPPPADEPLAPPESEPAAKPLDVPAQEPAGAPAGDVGALLAEFGFHGQTPSAVPDAAPLAAPEEKSAAAAPEAPKADAAAVDALLAEFGFHEEAGTPTQPDGAADAPLNDPAQEVSGASQADSAAVDALLAEFGFVPDVGESGESDSASPTSGRRGAGKRKIVDEAPESSDTTASKRRGGRKKAENP